MSLITYFLKGGFIMWPILISSIISVAIFIERLIYYKNSASGKAFVDKYCKILASGNVTEATDFAKKSKGACAALMVEGADYSGHRLTAFMEMRAGIIMARYRDRLNYISVIVTLAPLMGLLGTISGMIAAFNIFNLKAGEPMAITGGIGEALIATAAGLLVAILSLILHAYLANKMDNLITELEQCSSALAEAKSRGDN